MFSPRNFIVTVFAFTSVVYLELSFVNSVKKELRFIFFHMGSYTSALFNENTNLSSINSISAFPINQMDI